MGEAADLLGRPFALRGPIVHGEERGRTIGFPTINLGLSPDLALPADGVYVSRTEVGGRRLENPPALVVSDMDLIEAHTNSRPPSARRSRRAPERLHDYRERSVQETRSGTR